MADLAHLASFHKANTSMYLSTTSRNRTLPALQKPFLSPSFPIPLPG